MILQNKLSHTSDSDSELLGLLKSRSLPCGRAAPAARRPLAPRHAGDPMPGAAVLWTPCQWLLWSLLSISVLSRRYQVRCVRDNGPSTLTVRAGSDSPRSRTQPSALAVTGVAVYGRPGRRLRVIAELPLSVLDGHVQGLPACE